MSRKVDISELFCMQFQPEKHGIIFPDVELGSVDPPALMRIINDSI